MCVQACRFGNVQHLEHLLFYGADMSSQNASGNTALHLCALYNQVTDENRLFSHQFCVSCAFILKLNTIIVAGFAGQLCPSAAVQRSQ